MIALFDTQTVRRAAMLIGLFAAAGLASAQGPAKTNPKVKLTTSMGVVVFELYPDAAPKTVENVLQYVKAKHYDGTIFHRVIDNFMIQGGGMNAEMQEKVTRPPVEHEGKQALAKGLKNTVGMLAMARTNDPNSATGQFFINVRDNAFLDPTDTKDGYTVFGKVVSGMDVVDKIKVSPVANKGGHGNVPVTPIFIKTATLEK